MVLKIHTLVLGFLGGSVVKNPPANAGDMGSSPGSGRALGEGNGNPLQYSCIENPMAEEPGGLQSVGSEKSWTRLNESTTVVLVAALARSQEKLQSRVC